MDSTQVSSKAQEILDSFMKEMNSISLNSNFNLNRKISYREEKEGSLATDEFRDAFLNNAINRSQDAIITKKGDWV
ncbi:MAG: hypothetical protein LAT82_01855 [Nanoarchaeota archaeon]|nr:hypothetical protein [Nanoarchaeota archaeon]